MIKPFINTTITFVRSLAYKNTSGHFLLNQGYAEKMVKCVHSIF